MITEKNTRLKEIGAMPLVRTVMLALHEANVRASSKAQGIVDAYSRDTLAIDDTIAIIVPSNLKGWSDPRQIEIKSLATEGPLLTVPSLDQLIEKYGPIRKPQRNEPKFTVFNWHKLGDNEIPALALWLGQSDMEQNIAIEFLAQRPIIEGPHGTYITLYEAYRTKRFDFWWHLPNLVTVTPVIVSLDDKVLFTRRSSDVFYYPSHWEVSISEQMNPMQELDQRAFIWGAIQRSIWEELGQVEISSITVLGFYREVTNLNVNVAALVRVDADEHQVISAMGKAVDRYEHTIAEFRPWSLEHILDRFLNISYQSSTASELSGPYHPSARMRLLLAMLADFSPERVLSSLMEI